MIKVNFDKVFLLGLYAYLRQVKLSIDRVLYDSWSSLVVYFEDKTPPQKVISRLESETIGNINLTLYSDSTILNIRLLDKIIARILAVFGKSNYLSKTEITNIYSALKTFSILLTSSQPPDKDIIIQLRMQLNSYCDSLEIKLPKKDVNKAQYIEHFNQNKFLHCISLEDMVGGAWLK